MKKLLTFVALFLACSPFLPGGEPAESESPPDMPRNHHFFVGIDLMIPYEDGLYSIEKVWNRQAQIKVDGQVVAEDIKRIKEISYTRQTKISEHYARIENLTCEPSYSIGRDPQVKAARMQMELSNLASDSASFDEDALRRAMVDQNQVASPFLPDFSQNSLTQINRDPADFQYFERGMQLQEMSTQVNEYGEQFANADWDQLHIKFTLQADQYYPTGHIVFIFQLKEEPEGEPTISWFHFLSLKDISPEEQTFDYQVPAFPDGMYIDSQDLFLFVNGSEVATNYSPKHVEMTEPDARIFLNYQYLARNEGKTRPPQRVWRYLSPDMADRVYSGLTKETITLKIDKEGQVTDVVMSPAVQKVLNADNIHEISSEMYLPALEDGKPVDGELTLRLGDIVF